MTADGKGEQKRNRSRSRSGMGKLIQVAFRRLQGRRKQHFTTLKHSLTRAETRADTHAETALTRAETPLSPHRTLTPLQR